LLSKKPNQPKYKGYTYYKFGNSKYKTGNDLLTKRDFVSTVMTSTGKEVFILFLTVGAYGQGIIFGITKFVVGIAFIFWLVWLFG
jgi:hypothetical protein